jgi:23S rRNA U2552 (ribose-2'-O)-methylase RlmE/FtsJ
MSLTKTPEGLLEKTRANLTELIDRYVPRHTREEVWEMQRLHEERVWDLLSTIHMYRERNQQMAERMNAMEEEYYEHTRIPVNLGAFKADAFVDITMPDMAKTYQVTWRPDTYRAQLRLAYQPISKEDHPHLFEATMRQFEKEITRTLIPKLQYEFSKLYAADNYR